MKKSLSGSRLNIKTSSYFLADAKRQSIYWFYKSKLDYFILKSAYDDGILRNSQKHQGSGRNVMKLKATS